MKKITITLVLVSTFLSIHGQEKIGGYSLPELKKNLNEDGSNYIKVGILAQFWGRYTDLNPGSTVDGFSKSSLSDIGIRRLRFNVSGQLTDRTAFHIQFGQNNYSYLSNLYSGSFFHDAVGEYKVLRGGQFTVGGGLTGYSGLLRYAAPSVGSILGLDAPLYQQATNSINDQFLRKLGVYAKGQVRGFDYRFVLSKPMVTSNSTVPLGVLNSTQSTFSLEPPSWQQQAYIHYQFFEKESNAQGYKAGTYLGKKKIINVGAGVIHQVDAMWRLNSIGDTSHQDMTLYGVDLFVEFPLSARKNAITFYGAWSDYDMGLNYLRNVGVMNPANGGSNLHSLSGGGNNLPLIGTGQSLYFQLGYKFKDQLFSDNGSLQINANTQQSDFQFLDQRMSMYELGIAWLVHGTQGAKITLGWQNRPVFQAGFNNSEILRKETTRKDMFVLQYQISI